MKKLIWMIGFFLIFSAAIGQDNQARELYIDPSAKLKSDIPSTEGLIEVEYHFYCTSKWVIKKNKRKGLIPAEPEVLLNYRATNLEEEIVIPGIEKAVVLYKTKRGEIITKIEDYNGQLVWSPGTLFVFQKKEGAKK